MSLVAGQSQDQLVSNWYDKVPSKFLAWNEDMYKKLIFALCLVA